MPKLTAKLQNRSLNTLVFKKEVTQALLDKMAIQVDKHFDTRQGAWQPLTAFTIRERALRGYGPTPILEQSGDLRKHAVTDNQVETDGTHGHIGTEWPYAADMEFGVPERMVPARPFYEMEDNEDFPELLEALKQAVEAAWTTR